MMATGPTYGNHRLNQYLLSYVNELYCKQHFLSLIKLQGRVEFSSALSVRPEVAAERPGVPEMAAVPSHCGSSLCLCPFGCHEPCLLIASLFGLP